MRKQSEIELGLLLMLVEEADGDGELLLPEEAAVRFNPPLSVIKAKTSLNHLYDLGFVDWSLKDGYPAYFATRDGARIVEDSFHHVEINGASSWSPKAGVLLDADKLVTTQSAISEESEARDAAVPPAGWTINNNIFQENKSENRDTQSSSATAAAWIGVVVAVIAIGVALWLGGKL